MATRKSSKALKKPAKAQKVWGSGGMPTVSDLKARAKELKVAGYSKMNKEQLVWAVQEAEGFAACFHRIPDCGIELCLFRPECLS